MSFSQLDPPIPVFVIGKGRGSAFAVIDYGPEHNLIWVTAMDETGEIWCAPNPTVRMQANWTMGRLKSRAEHHAMTAVAPCSCGKETIEVPPTVSSPTG
ncbi:hypothetical protein [Novosphingobium sp. JCM 18896]|uniref:hypothetical protein n=1 Tax=Novosphingobium sp. JCM 18896 TaxID=2989731 RepID=UPI002222D628|nr:hypothetical protein [Novosphingobium sp. JCM 18896]MCW1432163.1 hypothetical protein [Novosphingobium sp. JCM 18896]